MTFTCKEKRGMEKMRKFVLVLVLTIFSLFGTSFDCVKAKNNVEKTICQNDELSKLDNELNQVYKEALSKADNKDNLKQDQHKWIKERGKCNNIDCIQQSYVNRLYTVTQVLNDVSCHDILCEQTQQGMDMVYNELPAMKYDDLVIYKNGLGKSFLELISTHKTLIELAQKIEIKLYRDNYYVLQDFVTQKFVEPKIYIYKNGSLKLFCEYINIVHLIRQECKNDELCSQIEKQKINYHSSAKLLDLDIDNDGKKEMLQYDETMASGACDYQSYIIKSKDILDFISEFSVNPIRKCFKTVKFFDYGGKTYIAIESFDYSVIVYLVKKNEIDVIGKFKANITLEKK